MWREVVADDVTGRTSNERGRQSTSDVASATVS
jgi:hypothetical protein